MKTEMAHGFNKGHNRGTTRCRGCGKLTWKEYEATQSGLCTTCFNDAGMENEHNDGHHDESPDPACRFCQGTAADTLARERARQ